jgi:sugar fermentation stimulation protein A
MSNIFIPFQDTLMQSVFLERPNRFLIRCELNVEGEKTIVEAHLPDSGRLKELLIKGRKIWLLPIDKPERKTKWSAALVEVPDQLGFVSINSTLPNRLVEKALKNRAIHELEEWDYIRREYTYKGSRWDFLLQKDECSLALEVKGVTLIKNEVGYFPDAVTTRGARHVQELANIAKEINWEAALLFIVQRQDVQAIKPCEQIDPNFAYQLKRAQEAGVKLLGRKCYITLEGIHLGEEVPVLV